MQVEMYLGGVLVKAGGDLVLGLLQCHGVGVIDLLDNRVVAPAVRRAGPRELVGGLDSEARAVESRVERDVARRDRTGRRVRERLAEGEILEEVARIGLGRGHRALMRSMASAMATVRAAISARSSSTMRP